MIIYVDIDGTIFQTISGDYENSTPIMENIAKINKLYDEGNTIIYWTARGRRTGKNFFMLTIKQLIDAGCKFNSLDTTTKPRYDLIIDNLAKRIEEI